MLYLIIRKSFFVQLVVALGSHKIFLSAIFEKLTKNTGIKYSKRGGLQKGQI